MLAFLFLQLTGQTVGISKIQYSKMDTRVLQIFPAAALPHTGPHLHATLQRTFH